MRGMLWKKENGRGEEEMVSDMEGEKKGRGFRDLVRNWAKTRGKVHKMRH